LQKLYERTNSQGEVYKNFIDVYRLRVQDDIDFAGYKHGIYAEDPAGPLPDFQAFMTQAEQKALLPDWWGKSNRQAYEQIAVGSSDSSIHSTVEKRDIQRMYGNSNMPMVFRTVADRVCEGGVLP
jgi:hypothetical protein